VIVKVAQLFLAFLQKLIQTRLTVTDHSVHSPTLKRLQHLRVSDLTQVRPQSLELAATRICHKSISWFEPTRRVALNLSMFFIERLIFDNLVVDIDGIW